MQDNPRKKSSELPQNDGLSLSSNLSDNNLSDNNLSDNNLSDNKRLQEPNTHDSSHPSLPSLIKENVEQKNAQQISHSSVNHSSSSDSSNKDTGSASSNVQKEKDKPVKKTTTKKTTTKGVAKKAVKKSSAKKLATNKVATKKPTPKKASSKKVVSEKATSQKDVAKTVVSQAKGMGKKTPTRQTFKPSQKRMVSDLHPASLSSSDINQSSQNCVSMTGDKEVEENISKVHSSKSNMSVSVSTPLKKPSKEKVRELFERTEKKLTEVFNIKDYPSIIPATPSEQAFLIIEKIKAFHAGLSKQDISETSPSSYVRKLEKDLHNAILKAFEDTGDIDQLCEEVYSSPRLYIEQKAMFREAVVRLFSINATLSRAPQSKPVIVDVFGLPSFGDIASAKKLLSNKEKMQQLCKMLVSSHAISDKSFSVAVLSIPLRHDALSKPSVLHVLSSVWGAYVAQEDKVDDLTGKEILNSVVEKLKPYEVTEGTMGFVFVGVRVWKGSVSSYKDTNELLSQWNNATGEEKTVTRTWWQLATGRMLMDLDIEKGSLLIRPPAPPLASQAQSLSWHITQQIYDRLGMAPFDEINFVTVSENNLALRAYDHRKKLVAQSDSVPLFDVVASAEDFSTLMKEECEATGPRSLLRELSRKK